MTDGERDILREIEADFRPTADDLIDIDSLIASRDDALGALDTKDATIAALRAELAAAQARERAVGADMVAIVNAAAAYLAVMTWSPSQQKDWKPGNAIPDYRTPENRLRKLLAGPARPHVELLGDLAVPAKTINDLRARLDTALAHIGALVGDTADEDTRDAARAWLQRG